MFPYEGTCFNQAVSPWHIIQIFPNQFVLNANANRIRTMSQSQTSFSASYSLLTLSLSLTPKLSPNSRQSSSYCTNLSMSDPTEQKPGEGTTQDLQEFAAYLYRTVPALVHSGIYLPARACLAAAGAMIVCDSG